MQLIKNHRHINPFTASLLVLAMAFIVGLMIIFQPVRADILAYEDGVIENFSATFLLLSSFLMGYICWRMSRERLFYVAIAAGLLSLIFFVIGMEEISWLQRVFDITTPESFVERNDQQELNFHNMATRLTERIYYFGAFTLLTLLPFLRSLVKNLLQKVNLQKMEILLPASWLLAPFAVSSFLKYEFYKTTFYATVFALTLVILVLGVLQLKSYTSKPAVLLYLSLSAGVFLTAAILIIDPSANNTRPWFPSEYREFFIALGILYYSANTIVQMRASVTKNLAEPHGIL